MAAELPFVTVIVPARNEGAEISTCIEAVARQTYPLDLLQVLVVDGASTDETVAAATDALSAAPFGMTKVLSNPAGNTPSNLNVGLEEAQGSIVCRVDARSIIPHDYVEKCVARLVEDAQLVGIGGAQVARPRDGSAVAVGIARALNNPLGMGGSRYRSGAPSGPADTVYLGAYRTRDLRSIGGWSEAWHTNQDFELNRRMAAMGTLWFESSLAVAYLPRRRLSELWRQYRRFGQWKVRYWRTTGDRPQRRQYVLLALPVVGSAAGAALLRVGSRRPVAMVAAVGAGAVWLESKSSGPDGRLRSRVVSLAASGIVAGGWLSGVASEMARRSGRTR